VSDAEDNPDDIGSRVRSRLRTELGAVLWSLRWIVIGVVVGVIAGLASAALLVTLTWATDTRLDHGWLLWLLPAAGLVIGLAYHYSAGRAAEGNNLIIEEIHQPDAGVPRRMAPLIFAATVVTQLFGGSAGREGTGIQVSVSLNDSLARVLPFSPADRRVIMISAMSAGFGALFGVPIAGALFGLEVQSVGRLRYEGLVPALTASLVGDLVVRGLGVKHVPTPELPGFDITVTSLLRVVALGVAFGLVGIAFILGVHSFRHIGSRLLSWPPARPILGGLLVIGLTLVVGNRDYLGLSLPLAESALAGNETSGSVFALKLLFTAVTLGFGFYGGEVTPLMIIGSTLGAALAPVVGLPIALGAALGYVAVLAGAANIPITCTVMAVEFFGGHALVPAALACVVAYIFSSHRSIYETQRIAVTKSHVADVIGMRIRDVGRSVRHRSTDDS